MEPAIAGVSPMIERTVVVLPMPLRPISVTISPGAMASDMPNSTWLQAVAGLDVVDLEQRGVSHARRLLLAEIGLAHLGIGADRLRRAGGDDAAVDQHGDAVGEREHRLHVVLDQQDGQLALELAQQSRPCARISSGPMPAIGSSSSSMRGVVASAMAISSWRCSPWLSLATSTSRAVGEADARQRRARGLAQLGLAARVAPEAEGMAGMRLHGERHVVERGEIGEQRGDLERAREAELRCGDRSAAR